VKQNHQQILQEPAAGQARCCQHALTEPAAAAAAIVTAAIAAAGQESDIITEYFS